MGIKFLIDSASDVLPEEAARLGVSHLAMRVRMDGREYADPEELSHRAFFEKLETCRELPTTSQISPHTFEERFRQLTASGDEVVAITLSSGLSGTYQSACIGAMEFPGKVWVVDSLQVTVGERILLLRGLELASQGLSAREIAEALDREKKQLRLIAVIDTLEYLKKGGRISPATALAGSLLSFKPAVELRDGLVSMAGKARGSQKANHLLAQLIDGTRGVNWDRPAALLYSGLDDSRLQAFVKSYPQYAGLQGHSLGCTIGTHIGPGAYGIAFFEKEES